MRIKNNQNGARLDQDDSTFKRLHSTLAVLFKFVGQKQGKEIIQLEYCGGSTAAGFIARFTQSQSVTAKIL